MVSLVLVGLIAAISGTAVITATRSYLFARENNAITQKAQLALGRLNRELIELSDIKDANSTCVVYESPYGRRAIARARSEFGLSLLQLFIDYMPVFRIRRGHSDRRGAELLDPVQPEPGRHGKPVEHGVMDIQNLFAVYVDIILSRPTREGPSPSSRPSRRGTTTTPEAPLSPRPRTPRRSTAAGSAS